ncbi:MAG: beta-phosphoglucomutase family hydrolase [Bacteroidetes bacterium]|nr:beta-phosphoglucomutase family hydrolase [Bacteroidota bacterium]
MPVNSFDAVIFDLDGVITKTARVHSAAWKTMFDEFLKNRELKFGEPFREFRHDSDYLAYIDGKPRDKGIESFLESRGICLPFGSPEDRPGKETVCGLGNRKNQAFNKVLEKEGVEVFDSSVRLIRELKEKGIRIGVASSSKNCKAVLERAKLTGYFETRVDGEISAHLGLKGKPEPDIFRYACDNLSVSYDRAVIVEDAVSGVVAGAAGNFGLIIGVAREDNKAELKAKGADIVVNDLAEITLETIDNWFRYGLEENGWSISYHDYDPEKERSRETLLTVGNGYFGTRGAMEESVAGKFNYPGTYIAGLYNKLPSEVGGKTIYNEDFVNCPNWLPVSFRVEQDEWLDINNVEILHIERKLDFKRGVLLREMIVRDSKGRETMIRSKRTASMDNPHLAGMMYTVTPLNYSAIISIRAGLDGCIVNDGVERYRQLNRRHLHHGRQGSEGGMIYITAVTTQSKIEIAEAINLYIADLKDKVSPVPEVIKDTGQIYAVINTFAKKNRPVCFEKIVAICTSKDKGSKDPLDAAKIALASVYDFDDLAGRSEKHWKRIWEEADVRNEGDRLSQKLLRLHIYHTMITTSRHNLNIDAGIPARGLHGEAYRGHIFWDELYLLPFYNIHFSDIAGSVLMYRYRRLDKAREYAKKQGFSGAMFPWQSGSDGSEETQVLHLNPKSGKWGDDYSSLQRHVSLAIAYNVWQYYLSTGDIEFLQRYGAEIFFEIGRFWAGKCKKNAETGRYDIAGVMGPDEFHEKYHGALEGGLKNNAYTNIMAAWLFRKANELADHLPEKSRTSLFDKIGLSEKEVQLWMDISRKLNLCISGEGIIAQYDGYFDLKELDWEAYRKKYGNIYRMDRILKAEGLSPDEYKVSKQADTLMVFYNLPAREVTSILADMNYIMPEDYIRKNLEYYLQRTSHGSTLSRMVHAYLALLADENELSWTLYNDALGSDFSDIQGGTTAEGIHAGVMAGTVMMAVTGYAGIDCRGEVLRIDPKLPAHWKRIAFGLTHRNIRYEFDISKASLRIKASGCGQEVIQVFVSGNSRSLKKDVWQELLPNK